MQLADVLAAAMSRGGSDIFIIPGSEISVKINGLVTPILEGKLHPADTLALIRQVYAVEPVREISHLMETGDDDFSFSLSRVGRFRCSAFTQRNSYAMVLRVMSFELPKPEPLHIPPEVLRLCGYKKGMVLVTGPAGSGKSTTLACMVDRINSENRDHIITIEDPIEFVHPHKRSVVTQREVGHDTVSYHTALRAALRQAPDVILLGEMRDYETIATALTAAETGQFLLSSLHTVGAAKTVDRIVDVFPANQQQQVRVQLSMVLRAVVSQQLVPTTDGGRTPAFEVMTVNGAIANMIREGKGYQMDNVIYAGAAEGMRTMDGDLARLYGLGQITRDTALLYASNPDTLSKKLQQPTQSGERDYDGKQQRDR